jgi:hypothetical protein
MDFRHAGNPEPFTQAREKHLIDVDVAAQEFGAAMLGDAEYGALLRLVRREVTSQEKTNCERYISPAAERAYQRQVRRLRRIERKLARQRLALRGGTKTY